MNHIDQLIKEADGIIDGRKPVESPQTDDSDTVKLAIMLVQEEAQAPISQETLIEKLAHAVAIVDVAMNFEEFNKLAQFQDTAAARGIPAEQISAYLEKKAESLAPKSLARYLVLPAAAATALAGHAMGKRKGYKAALEDVNQAFSTYAAQQQQPNG